MPTTFTLLATPLWVNLLVFVPILFWLYWKHHKLQISIQQLSFAAIFGTAFGFIECACVIYLRASTGFLPGFQGTLADVQKHEIGIFYIQQLLADKLPPSLLTVEIIREAATIIMLLSIAYLGARYLKERIAIFLLAFSFWDFFYYIFLYLTIRWPENIMTKDVLFLIPQPWFAQVWFPMLIDIFVVVAILLSRSRKIK